jgi:hypothetical protein
LPPAAADTAENPLQRTYRKHGEWRAMARAARFRRKLRDCELPRRCPPDNYPNEVGVRLGTTQMNCNTGGRIDNWDSTLAELVRDPLIGLVMKSDGVERSCIEALFERLAQERRKMSAVC